MDGELAAVLGLNVDLVRQVLGRRTYTKWQEWEAEVFGTVVVERAVRVPAVRQPVNPEAAAVLHRVEAALTGSNDDPDDR
jgi:hypothetical protein